MPSSNPHRVVIVGGGFGGLCTAQALRRAPVDVTLVDRSNHHLFQPLLYQVATGALSPANIAAPLRSLVKRSGHTRVALAEVVDFDLGAREVELAGGDRLPYDSLVVAAGAGHHYFGHDEWEERAPGLKTIEDARRIRRRVLLAFERAERADSPQEVERLLTFVVVGGGPTGVELAGALAEVSRGTLPGEFRKIDPSRARVLLIEGADRLLGAFAEASSERAKRDLEGIGVEVRLSTFVDEIDEGGVTLRQADSDAQERVAAETVLWAAGVQASPLGARLAEATGAETTRSGQVVVEEDCTLPGHPEIYVVGDLASFSHGDEGPLPGVAPVAMQQGRYVAQAIRQRLRGEPLRPFRYQDKGMMATIGRRLAVAEVGALRFGGAFAWLAWLFIHLLYLTEFQNRLLVLVQWGWSYFTRNRSARLVSPHQGEVEHDPEPEAAPSTPPA